MISIGKNIIAQVKSVFVFGSGNDPIAEENTGGWSKQIALTPRIPQSFIRSDATWRLNQVGEAYARGLDAGSSAKATGAAMSARIGNCKENALLAIYFAMQIMDEEHKPVFSKLSLVKFDGVDHAFVMANYSSQGILYIDPWQNQTYTSNEFCENNDGRLASDLVPKLEVITDESQCKNQYYVGFPLSYSIFTHNVSRKEYLNLCNMYIEQFMIGSNVHPSAMDSFLEKHRLDNIKFLTAYEQYVDQDQLHLKKNLLKDIMGNKEPADSKRVRRSQLS